jgi:hypothetical protein
MSPNRHHQLVGGPHTGRPGAEKVYRGSRRRLTRIRWQDHTSTDFLLFVVLALLTIFFSLVWVANHPSPDSPEQTIESR